MDNHIMGILIQIFPYLLLLILHHFVLAPLFFKKNLFVYVPVTLALLTAFGFYCFKVGNPQDFRPGGPKQFQGPPPMMQQGVTPPPRPMDDFRRPMDDMRQPMMSPDNHRPMRPETMKLLIGLLLVLVDLGVMVYFRNLHTE